MNAGSDDDGKILVKNEEEKKFWGSASSPSVALEIIGCKNLQAKVLKQRRSIDCKHCIESRVVQIIIAIQAISLISSITTSKASNCHCENSVTHDTTSGRVDTSMQLYM